MRLVACGIPAMLQEQFAVRVTLRQLTCQIAVFLLSIHIAYQSFLCLEVESHGIALILVTAHREHRGTEHRSRRVFSSRGMHQAAVHVHVYPVALQIHVLIKHVRVAEQVGYSCTCLVYDRVFRRVRHGRVYTVLSRPVSAVKRQRIVYSPIVMIYRKLQRVHPGGIRSVMQRCHNGVRRQRVQARTVNGRHCHHAVFHGFSGFRNHGIGHGRALLLFIEKH